MTPLIANFNTISRSTRPTAPPSNFRMPHVFVIPPEEEQEDNPPWCCFDADEQPENNGDFPSNPDIHFLDVPYLFQRSDHDIPSTSSRRTSVRQPRPRAPSKKLEKKQRPEAIRIIENKPPRLGRTDMREDSDVVEVVKVKRSREALTDLEENTKAKRSKTLRARATKALLSVKNVGKGSHRTHVKEIWSSSESTPGIFKGMHERIRSQRDEIDYRPPVTPAKKGSLSRATSRLFHSVRRMPPEPSFTLRLGTSEARNGAYDTSPAATPTSLSRPGHSQIDSPFIEVSRTFMTDDAFNRSMTPTPSMKKKHLNTRFSVRELHRLFSFASSSSPDDPLSAPNTTTLSSSLDSDVIPSTSTSIPSSARPDVPMEDDIFADAHFLNLESPDRKLASRYSQTTYPGDHLPTPCRLSLEMRLNSLHFDSLSFDPEDFDVSMDGDVLR